MTHPGSLHPEAIEPIANSACGCRVGSGLLYDRSVTLLRNLSRCSRISMHHFGAPDQLIPGDTAHVRKPSRTKHLGCLTELRNTHLPAGTETASVSRPRQRSKTDSWTVASSQSMSKFHREVEIRAATGTRRGTAKHVHDRRAHWRTAHTRMDIETTRKPR